MPRRGETMPRPWPGDPADPRGLTAWALQFLEALRVRQFTARTVRLREEGLRRFLAWTLDRGLSRPNQITRPILQRYQRHLFHLRKQSGKPLSVSTQMNRLVAVRQLFRWLTRENVILSNPASELELPRRGRRLPKDVLTASEAEAVLALPDLADPLGIRDRALLETFYSTGIRRMELAGLTVFDIDWENGTLRVLEGKGRKDRVVPIGERAMAFVDLYLRETRPLIAMEPDEGTLFLTRTGVSFTPSRLSQLVRHYIEAADLEKHGSCHLFRHAMATAMLENGADIRFIQEMLGHADLSTTQIYTRVSIRKLKEIHTATHPGARLERVSQGAEPGPGPDPDPGSF